MHMLIIWESKNQIHKPIAIKSEQLHEDEKGSISKHVLSSISFVKIKSESSFYLSNDSHWLTVWTQRERERKREFHVGKSKKRKQNKNIVKSSLWKRERRKRPGHQLREVEGSLSAKKRMRLALFFGASDRNFSNTPSKLDTVASNTFNVIFSSLQTKKWKNDTFSGVYMTDHAPLRYVYL